MTRPRLLLVVVATVVGLGIWLMLREVPQPIPNEVDKSNEAGVVDPARTEAERGVARDPVAKRTQAESPGASGRGRQAAGVVPLRGVIKEIQGGGIPDVLLELVDGSGFALAATTSDEAGAFAFEAAVPGATALMSRPAPGGLPRVRHPRGLLAAGAAVTLWRPPSGVIRGTVIDASGRPVAQAAVRTDRPFVPMGMMPLDIVEGPEPKMTFEARADATGHFELPFAARGAHRLRSSHGGISGSVVCDANEQGVVLRLGVHHGGDVVLAGRLADRVTGNPVAGARVSVMRVRVTKGGHSSTQVASAVSGPQGRYEVRGLDAGTYGIHSMPDGFAAADVAVRQYDNGQHMVDLLLDPARSLSVRVVLPDGRPAKGIRVQVLTGAGERVQVPGRLGMLGESVAAGNSGLATLRRLPAELLTLRAVAGDLLPAGELTVDLRASAPKEVSIAMPTVRRRFTRTHYFILLGADGKPAEIEGAVIARSLDATGLVSHVEGRWRGKQFVFGHEGRSEFDHPTIAVHATSEPCRIELSVPGYRPEVLTLAPDAKSPTRVTLRR